MGFFVFFCEIFAYSFILNSNNCISLMLNEQGYLRIEKQGNRKHIFQYWETTSAFDFRQSSQSLLVAPGLNVPLEISSISLATVLLCVTAKCSKCIDGSGLMEKLSGKTSVLECCAAPEGILSLSSLPLCFCVLHPNLFS